MKDSHTISSLIDVYDCCILSLFHGQKCNLQTRIPAQGMRIELHRLSPHPALLGEYVTNDDGRLPQGAALRGGTAMMPGVYEWTFYVGDYFAAQGTYTTGQPFLNAVPLRFGIDNPDDHYHVPLLVSPWSFSTYRGS